MLTANAELRSELRAAGIPIWVIAKRMNIHEKTLYAYLRTELEGERRERVMAAANEVLSGR